MTADVIEIFKSLGIPVGVMLLMLFAGWRAAKWLAPRADKIIESHTEFVKRTADSVVGISTRLDDIHNDIRTLAGNFKSNHRQ